MEPTAPILSPPESRRHVSVARLGRYWYIACQSRELTGRPLQRTILGIPLVLFRSATGPAAVLDRCPHRNAPLSAGAVVDGTLRCGYHGWRFDGAGECVEVPSLCGEHRARGRNATRFATREQDGFVWVHTAADEAPDTAPYTLPHVGEPGYTTVRASADLQASLHATLENILDVPHTAFLHAGLFRTSAVRHRVTAVVRRQRDRVEAQYVGEPVPTGMVGRILAPGGGEVRHFDRFLLPSIAQVEYGLGERSHLVATQALTPVTDFHTRMFVTISYRLPMPGWLIRPFVEPILRRVLRQDATMLQLQSENIRRFGGERYVSTEIDVLGPPIWQLLRAAERGELTDGERQHEVQLDV